MAVPHGIDRSGAAGGTGAQGLVGSLNDLADPNADRILFWNDSAGDLAFLSPSGSTGATLIGFLPSGAGAVIRTAQSKMRDIVSVTDFGAVGDGVTNDTTAFQNCADSGALTVLVPPGTYLTNQVNWATKQRIVGDRATIKPASVFAGPFWYFTGDYNVIEGLSFDINRTTYSGLICVYLDGADHTIVRRCTFNQAGRYAVYGWTTAYCKVEDCDIENVGEIGVLFDSAATTSQFNSVTGCAINASGNISHGIQFAHGTDCSAINNTVRDATIFGISSWLSSRTRIISNSIFDTVKEGINLDKADACGIANNIIFWTGTASTDFGLSLVGDATNPANYNVISGNIIAGSYKAGIALDNYVSYSVISANSVVNPNREDHASGAGIQVYGSNTTFNKITENRCLDFNTKMKYGVAESNFNGSGTPSNEFISNNTSQGHVTAPYLVVASTIAALNGSYSAWVPTVTSGTGALTSYTVNTARYLEVGNMVFIEADITITDAGTGATSIVFTLPFTASTIAVLNGRENVGTGSQLHGLISASGTTAACFTYANGFPGATGNRLLMSGVYLK